MDKRQLLEETELFVLDMDGTFYLDTTILDGSLEFLRQVERLGKRYVFFTNNSSKSPKTYIEDLLSRKERVSYGDAGS
jgi:ribonucleotide monophosphatase NagD (HAD superfamily)